MRMSGPLLLISAHQEVLTRPLMAATVAPSPTSSSLLTRTMLIWD
jgi:hypothetical protein